MPALKVGYDGLFYFFQSLDMFVQTWVEGQYNPFLIKIMIGITYLGFSATYIFMSILISGYLIYKRKALEAVFLNISLFSAWGTMWFLKNLFMRGRPLGEALTAAGGFSFPSGHAMVSMAFYGFLATLLISEPRGRWSRYGAAALFILVILIGLSRVYLNVHYASDVLAGFLFGFICLAICIKGLRITQHFFIKK